MIRGLWILLIFIIGSSGCVPNEGSHQLANSKMQRANRPVNSERAKEGFGFISQLPLGDKVLAFEDFDDLYLAWDGEDAKKAKGKTPEVRRQIALKRYGWVNPPFENNGLPMGLVYNSVSRGIHINCLMCHAGQVRGVTALGLPNQRVDFATFLEDAVVLSFIKAGEPVPPRPINIPDVFVSEFFSNTRGGSSVWISSGENLAWRSPTLEQLSQPPTFSWRNFDTTPPPFWNIKKKFRIYHAGMITFGARPISIAALSGDVAQFIALQPNFENLRHYLDSIEPPKYPGPIDADLAATGKVAFEKTCSRCHGTYGDGWTYPNKDISIGSVGTDDVELIGIGYYVQYYFAGWFNDFGKTDSMASLKRQSYLAPPLDGIWASAPYFHNGSVPSLYHVLHPDQRPSIWKVRDYDAYDDLRVGLLIDDVNTIPGSLTASDRRRYFDTSAYGQGKQGHLYPNELSESEKIAVLEYLKTL